MVFVMPVGRLLHSSFMRLFCWNKKETCQTWLLTTNLKIRSELHSYSPQERFDSSFFVPFCPLFVVFSWSWVGVATFFLVVFDWTKVGVENSTFLGFIRISCPFVFCFFFVSSPRLCTALQRWTRRGESNHGCASLPSQPLWVVDRYFFLFWGYHYGRDCCFVAVYAFLKAVSVLKTRQKWAKLCLDRLKTSRALCASWLILCFLLWTILGTPENFQNRFFACLLRWFQKSVLFLV